MQKLLRADPSLLLGWALITAGVFVVFGLVFHKFETLFAGLLGLLGGLSAFIGVLQAADRQVDAARQAAADEVDAMWRTSRRQVDAVEAQMADLQAERKRTDRRRRSVVEWAVKVEGMRLATAAEAMMKEAVDVDLGPSLANEQLTIDDSPLLRGEREDIALLDDKTRQLLELTANTLAAYNVRIRAAPRGSRPSLIVQNAQHRLEELVELARQLREI